jgi:hypothetical protein
MGIWQTIKWFFDSEVRKKVNFVLDPKVFNTKAPIELLATEVCGNHPDPLRNPDALLAPVGRGKFSEVDVVESTTVSGTASNAAVDGEESKSETSGSEVVAKQLQRVKIGDKDTDAGQADSSAVSLNDIDTSIAVGNN